MHRPFFMAIALFFLSQQSYVAEAGTRELREIKTVKEIFKKGVIKVVGVSAPGQSEYAARQAAEIIAQAKLVAIVNGMWIEGDNTIEKGKNKENRLRRRINGFLRYAFPCGEEFDPAKGKAKACLKMNLKGEFGLYNALYPVIIDHRVLPKEIDGPDNANAPDKEGSNESSGKSGQAENSGNMENPDGQGVDESVTGAGPYDGLIVDVSAFDTFQPAFKNRIVTTKDRIVFKAGDVATRYLNEHGPARFVHDRGKALEVLKEAGCKKPFIVKATDVKRQTDVVVSFDDAFTIATNNGKSAMLNKGRVVYLLGNTS